jgi:hypothetical protein
LVAPQSEITIRTESHDEDASILPETETGDFGGIEEEDIYGTKAAEREAARKRLLEQEPSTVSVEKTPPPPEVDEGEAMEIHYEGGDEGIVAAVSAIPGTPTSPGGRAEQSPVPEGEATQQAAGEAKPKEPPVPKRKRLAVDVDMVISPEYVFLHFRQANFFSFFSLNLYFFTSRQMRLYLQNSDDLVRDLVVAPPTKKALVRREWELSSAEVLLGKPNARGLATVFTAYFHNLLRAPGAREGGAIEARHEAEREDYGTVDLGEDQYEIVGEQELPEREDEIEPIREDEEVQQRPERETARLEEGVVDTTGTIELVEETDSFEEIARKVSKEEKVGESLVGSRNSCYPSPSSFTENDGTSPPVAYVGIDRYETTSPESQIGSGHTFRSTATTQDTQQMRTRAAYSLFKYHHNCCRSIVSSSSFFSKKTTRFVQNNTRFLRLLPLIPLSLCLPPPLLLVLPPPSP